jgi:hypothetical protein
MVEVFRTNVTDTVLADKILLDLKQKFQFSMISFDLEDCDKILRLEAELIPIEGIREALICYGIQFETL